MATVMNKNNIAGLAVFDNAIKRFHNILMGRRVMASIVHQNQHILLLKTLVFSQIRLDIFDIIVATAELSLLTYIINTNKNSL